MARLQRSERMKLAFFGDVDALRFFNRRVRTKADHFAVGFDVRGPLGPVAVNAKHARRFVVALCFAHVLQVFRIGRLSQIAKPVVSFDAVDVVNEVDRVLSINMQPCQPMRKSRHAKQIDSAIACVGACGPRFRAGFDPSSVSVGCPSKNAGFRAIIQKLAHLLRGKIGCSHEAPRLLIGQRPVSVASTAPALPF